MGRSGNSKGFKVFSISTTIRNPYRNEEFLKCINEVAIEYNVDLLADESLEASNEILNKIYLKLIKLGIYRPKSVKNEVKNNWNQNIEISDEDAFEIIQNNPQKTDKKGGGANRTKTFLRALIYQNLIKSDEKFSIIQLTNIAKSLISNEFNDNDLYIKALINIQYGGVLRKTAFNKSMPFLNILNVIWKYYVSMKKSMSKYQFALILAMKNCDYNTCFKEITNIESFSDVMQKEYLMSKLEREKFVTINFDSLEKDYIDEVYRKIERTGLFEVNIQKYIKINENEVKKIELLIEQNIGYSFKTYDDNLEKYYGDIELYTLPWEVDLNSRREILVNKAEIYKIDHQNLENLNLLENQVLKVENKIYFEKIAKKININYCCEYIVSILKSNFNVKSKSNIDLDKTLFGEIKDFVKLEWFFSIILYRLSSDYTVIPGMNFNQYGYPKSHALGGKPDIELVGQDIFGIIELTMIKNKKQQLNNETTSIIKHLLDNDGKNKVFSILLAPVIHYEVVYFFNYSAILEMQGTDKKLAVSCVPIQRFLNWIKLKDNIFKISIEDIFNYSVKEFEDVSDKKMEEIKEILSVKNLENYIN